MPGDVFEKRENQKLSLFFSNGVSLIIILHF